MTAASGTVDAMKKGLVALGLIVVGVLALAVWVLSAPAAPPINLTAHNPDLANGRTMFLIGGCSSCHAVPKQEDATRLGGGLALPTAFGTFHVPNISPDAKDGIGRWSETQFITAMRYGVSPVGQHLYPAFPYTSYHAMRTEDLRDLFAYLQTLPAVSGAAPDHALKFPFNFRRTVGLWKLLFLDDAPFKSDAAQSPQWNRGAYLVNAPGHCAECHSPRNLLGAIISSRRFTGGQSPTGQGGVPDITQDKLHDWKTEDFVEVLDSGMTPDSDRVGGAMVEVVTNTRQLSAADREAMAVYLKSLRAK
jgi:mono/diheme cytochrome c family protein